MRLPFVPSSHGLLRALDSKSKVAPDVDSGLSFAKAAHFDAILVEFNLRSERRAHPRTGNGLQLIRKLRAMDIITPVLMLTAMEGELYETASLDAGADDLF